MMMSSLCRWCRSLFRRVLSRGGDDESDGTSRVHSRSTQILAFRDAVENPWGPPAFAVDHLRHDLGFAAVTSAGLFIEGIASKIGRPLRTGATRSRHNRRATVSPNFATSMALRPISSSSTWFN